MADYPQTNTLGVPVTVAAADWEQRLLQTVRQLRLQRKDAIVLFDSRTNTIRVFPAGAPVSVKLD